MVLKTSSRYKRRIIGIVTLAAVLFAALFLLNKYVLKINDSVARRLNGFYLEEENSLDVIILGASEISRGFSPPEAYSRNGFTSYIYSIDSNPVSLFKYELREILDRQTPQVLVVEVDGATKNDKFLYREGSIRRVTDTARNFGNKRALINDLCKDDKLSYYCSLIKYHSRWPVLFDGKEGWKEILAENKRGYSLMRGFIQYTDEEPAKLPREIKDVRNDRTMQELSPGSERCLREFVNMCKENGIENVLFVRFPHRIENEKRYKSNCKANKVGEIAAEYGYDFLNMNQLVDEIGIDEYDFNDSEHMNLKGAIKTTAYLSDYVTEKYNIQPTPQSEEQKEEWAESVKYFDLLTEYWDKVPRKEGEKGWIKFYGDNIGTVEALDNFAAQKHE